MDNRLALMTGTDIPNNNTSHNNIYAYCYECRSKLCENCKNSPYHDGHQLVLKY